MAATAHRRKRRPVTAAPPTTAPSETRAKCEPQPPRRTVCVMPTEIVLTPSDGAPVVIAISNVRIA